MYRKDHGISSVKSKVFRAEAHLNELSKIDNELKNIECFLIFETDENTNRGYFKVKLPEIPSTVPLIVGDCLNNLRSSLDHLVWQIVESAGIKAPSRSNMFPICTTKNAFDREVQRNRLQGVPKQAFSIIESLQPFQTDFNWQLDVLNTLCNKDKHRELNYAVSVASDMSLTYLKNNDVIMQKIISNNEIRNNEAFGNVGFDTSIINTQNIEIRGQADAFIAFEHFEHDNEDEGAVIDILSEITDHLKYEVIDVLRDFVN